MLQVITTHDDDLFYVTHYVLAETLIRISKCQIKGKKNCNFDKKTELT